MKEVTILKWSAIIACLVIGFIIGLSIPCPSSTSKLTLQQKQVADIKLCKDNGLQSYKGGNSRYYCKP